MHDGGRVCFSPLRLSGCISWGTDLKLPVPIMWMIELCMMAAGCVSLRSVFLAVFLEALLLRYHLIQLREVNFKSPVRYVRSPSFGGFASQSWLLLKPRSGKQRRDQGHFTRSVQKFSTINGYLTGLLLLCGDIASQPGPETFSFLQDKRSPKIKNILPNARSLTSVHRNTEGDSTI